MKKIITIAACFAASVTLSAQNNLNDPFGIGIATPQSQLHIHQTQAENPVLPPVPHNLGGGNRDQFFDDTYNTTLLMTNPNSGTTSTDGFLLQQQNWDIRFLQRENGYMLFQTPGGRMILSATGRFGHGDTISTHMFNVQGTARFASDVKMAQALNVDGAITAGGNVTVGGTLNTNGSLAVGTASSLGNLTVHGVSTMEYGMTVGGATTLQGALSVINNASVSGTLSVSGATSLTGPLAVGNGFLCDAQGNLKVKHLKVTLTSWPDYVFSGNHTLMPLNELEAYVNEHNHLPGVPSAKEVEENGADLGEMNKALVEKVEELTLYIIDLQKQINELKSNK